MNLRNLVVGSPRIYLVGRIAATIVASSLIGLGQVEGSTITAKSASRADVGAAVASAVKGDTVIVPAGTATWTSNLTITKHITLQGAGIGQTIIINGNTGGSLRPAVLTVNPSSTNDSLRITGFTFRGGNDTTSTFNGEVRINGTCHVFRMDHCEFDNLHGTGVTVHGDIWGVIDHCVFTTTSQQPLVIGHDTWGGGDNGNGSWADDPYWGSEKFLFVEDNTFDITGSQLIDSNQGARFVLRYNQLHNCGVTLHGTEGQGRGGKQIEEYNNVYEFDTPDAAGQIRSGSIITHDNTWKNSAKGHGLQAYRVFHKSPHWGPARGDNLYDVNDPEATDGYWEQGTHTGPAGSFDLVDSTKNWATNQWYKPGTAYIIRNRTTETDSTLHYTFAISNTATKITTSTLIFVPDVRTKFNPGDVYEIWKVNRALDQPGSGKTVLISGLGNWPSTMQSMNQEIEPCYSWNNKDAATGAVRNLAPTEPQIQEGRDVFNGTVKPGYTPYTYPHPLTGGDGDAPSPPQDLQILP